MSGRWRTVSSLEHRYVDLFHAPLFILTYLCIILTCSVGIIATLGLVRKRGRGTGPAIRAAASQTDLQTGR